VTFSDSQILQQIRRKLLRTITVLDSSLDVGNACSTSCKQRSDFAQSDLLHKVYGDLKNILVELETHRRAAVSILKYSTGTANLVS
jgi:hypothetical protein